MSGLEYRDWQPQPDLYTFAIGHTVEVAVPVSLLGLTAADFLSSDLLWVYTRCSDVQSERGQQSLC